MFKVPPPKVVLHPSDPDLIEKPNGEFRTGANYRRKQFRRWRAAHGGKPPKGGKGRRGFAPRRQNRDYIPPRKTRLQQLRESGALRYS